jgi:hypothetical protein
MRRPACRAARAVDLPVRRARAHLDPSHKHCNKTRNLAASHGEHRVAKVLFVHE